MVALVGAMFASVGSVSAAGQCRESGGVITLGFGQTCTVSHSDAAGTPDVTNVVPAGAVEATLVEGVVTITAPTSVSAATTTSATVTVHDAGADETADNDDDQTLATYTVRVVGLGIVSTEVVGDQDNTVPAGPQITARVTVRSPDDDAEVRVTVPSTGLSLESATAGESTQSRTIDLATISEATTAPNTDATDGVVHADIKVNTAGAPAGEYTITFEVDDNMFGEDNPSGVTNPSMPLTVIIGDPGTGLASATIALGNSSADVPYTADNEAVAETDTHPAIADETDRGIQLVIEAFDSRGGKANSGAIDQIIVIAPGGVISTDHKTGDGDKTAGGPSSATLSQTDANTDTSDTADPGVVGPRTVIYVKKAGGGQAKPGTVTVYAIVSGRGGAATTETLTLNFSGATTSISIADATDTLRSVNAMGDDPATTKEEGAENVIEDTIKLAVTGADSGGVANDPGTGFTITITDPDGTRVNSDKMVASLATKYASGKRDLTVTGKGSEASPLKAGEYTVMLKKGSLEASAKFSVAGSASEVMVSASAMTSDTIGDVITVTAEVTDADGNPVSDGTSVMFDVSEDTGLAAIGTGHMGKGTKDGSASVKYAVVGAGHSVVSATAGGATGVIVIDSTAGATDMAMPEEEASVACLSTLSGFSTWSCGVDSSASEIFGLVSGRGATALHLWNGSAWVRYSVVDGTMVPGSSDFMVTQYDTLYISN